MRASARKSSKEPGQATRLPLPQQRQLRQQVARVAHRVVRGTLPGQAPREALPEFLVAHRRSVTGFMKITSVARCLRLQSAAPSPDPI
jgi:hypothetical protein